MAIPTYSGTNGYPNRYLLKSHSDKNRPAEYFAITSGHLGTYNASDCLQAKYSFLREAGYGKFDTIHRADLRVSDISNLLGGDWVRLARELAIEEQDINLIITEYPDNVGQQAMVMLRYRYLPSLVPSGVSTY